MGQKAVDKAKRYILIGVLLATDILIVSSAPFIAFWLRFDGQIAQHWLDTTATMLPLIVCVRLGIFYLFRLYHRVWRHASINEMMVVVAAVTVGSLVLFSIMQVTGTILPRSIWLISWLLNVLLVGASRLFLRVYYYLRNRYFAPGRIRILIVGAGDAGAMIAREILQRHQDSRILVGFVDDDQNKKHNRLLGAKILGTLGELPQLAEHCAIDEIIVAIPSASGSVLRQIVMQCKRLGCAVKTVPGIYELIDGKVAVSQLRNIDLEDLLRREQVIIEDQDVRKALGGKTILVTGAGGSIGSELCRQIARQEPRRLVLLGKGENSIYDIHQELQMKFPELEINAVIADVRDSQRIHEVFDKFRPQAVFHAAAHKHVPLMEDQPVEAAQNNIFGTKNVAEAACQFGAASFVMISTDKAVNPTSVMGATKRVSELLIQSMSCNGSGTRFCAVRFGNVLGSRGSVVPLFRKQIAAGGPVTVTDPEMRRYFMTIPEAVQLVLQAGALAQGGEVFVLDMGEPVRIVDLARDLIELSGLKPDEDIQIQFTGLRPGEKLFEELLTAEEGTTATHHTKIFRANLRQVDGALFQQKLLMLRKMREAEAVRTMIRELVPTYSRPEDGLLRDQNQTSISRGGPFGGRE
jgi:FlaA1/EpsC-like NDP-sugar epimerase